MSINNAGFLGSSAQTIMINGSGSRTSNEFAVYEKHLFITWSNSGIHDPDFFYKQLVDKLPEGTDIYGAKKLCKDHPPIYHAVIQFPKSVNWTDWRSELTLCREDGTVDTEAITLQHRRPKEPVFKFLEDRQHFCCKDGNAYIFGEWIGFSKVSTQLRKRSHSERVAEEDPVQSRGVLTERSRNIINYRADSEDGLVRKTRRLTIKRPKEQIQYTQPTLDYMRSPSNGEN